MHVRWRVCHACAMAFRPSMCNSTSTTYVLRHASRACAAAHPCGMAVFAYAWTSSTHPVLFPLPTLSNQHKTLFQLSDHGHVSCSLAWRLFLCACPDANMHACLHARMHALRMHLCVEASSWKQARATHLCVDASS
eukprot:57471-Chlamydomonas_euryale.AAC.1